MSHEMQCGPTQTPLFMYCDFSVSTHPGTRVSHSGHGAHSHSPSRSPFAGQPLLQHGLPSTVLNLWWNPRPERVGIASVDWCVLVCRTDSNVEAEIRWPGPVGPGLGVLLLFLAKMDLDRDSTTHTGQYRNCRAVVGGARRGFPLRSLAEARGVRERKKGPFRVFAAFYSDYRDSRSSRSPRLSRPALALDSDYHGGPKVANSRLSDPPDNLEVGRSVSVPPPATLLFSLAP